MVKLTVEEVDSSIGGVFKSSINGLDVFWQVVPEVVDDGRLTGQNGLRVFASPKVLQKYRIVPRTGNRKNGKSDALGQQYYTTTKILHTFSMNMNTSERMTAMALKFPLQGSMGAFRGGAKVFGPPPVSGRGVVRTLGGKVAYGPLPPIG